MSKEHSPISWKPFGLHQDGSVNVADENNKMLFEKISEETAAKLVNARKAFITRVKKIMAEEHDRQNFAAL